MKILSLFPFVHVDAEELQEGVEELGEEVEQAVLFGFLVAMEAFDEGHFEVGHGVVVKPDEENHKDGYQTSDLRDGVQYLEKASFVLKFLVAELKRHPHEDIGGKAIRVIRESRLAWDKKSVLPTYFLEGKQTAVSLDMVLRDLVTQSSIERVV